MRRLLDILGAAFGLVVSLPAVVVAAVAIKAADRGPVLFRQERIGQDGEPFEILKFRTMTVGAEHQGLGVVVAENDSRITAPGKALRLTSLDELPQLVNVLRGDMSLVGPRPTIRAQVERYTPEQTRRLEVKPGLTGWAQVNGRNSLPWTERIKLDVWYVENQSLWLDAKILVRTPFSLFKRESIYGVGGTTTDL